MPESCAGTTGLKEGPSMNTGGVGETNVARWRVSRKGDLTTLGTLKRSLTLRIKLRHCNCRRHRHCDSTFPSLFFADSSFRYLPSLTILRSFRLSPFIAHCDIDLIPLLLTRKYDFPSLISLRAALSRRWRW